MRQTVRFVATLLLFLTSSAQAQWQKMFTLPSTRGTCAYFFNANEGCIGTGEYQRGLPAKIFYTLDGGVTWKQSILPSNGLIGQVTDIHFRDRMNGWATISEIADQGFSGLYRSKDGGKSWNLVHQAQAIISVRETGRGIFLTDRSGQGQPGIKFSSDGGNSFKVVLDVNAPLGLDFVNDRVGYASTEGMGPHFRTDDGGVTWPSVNMPFEAWTTFCDPATGSVLFASERNSTRPSTSSIIARSRDNGVTFTNTQTAIEDALTGGITGYRGCLSAIYAQGQGPFRKSTTPGIDGTLRSTDGGLTWKQVGGPSNTYDTRFAVTGRGAVVYAFDANGGVWKTINGGDAAMTPFLTQSISIAKPATTVSAPVCDSTTVQLRFTSTACDSTRIARVQFPDDIFDELGVKVQLGSLKPFSSISGETLTLSFRPKRLGVHPFTLIVSIRHPDGFLEDTTVSIQLEGLPSREKFRILNLTSTKTIDFGKQSVCGGDSSREFIVENLSCIPLELSTVSTSGDPFFLRSTVTPSNVDAGKQRSFLIRFKPSVLGTQSGMLVISSGAWRDTITLRGEGIPGSRGLRLIQSPITSTLCDSAESTITIRNLSCSAVKLNSSAIAAPFYLLDQLNGQTVPVDGSVQLRVRFVPTATGPTTLPLAVNWTIGAVTLDTTLALGGEGTSGVPTLVLSRNDLPFGDVSTCEPKEEEVTLSNEGCSALDITSATLDNNTLGFTIVQAPVTVLGRGESTRVRVRFAAPGEGPATVTLTIVTSAGTRTLQITANGTSDKRALTTAVSSLPQITECDSIAFSASIENITCEDLTIVEIEVLGDKEDFRLGPYNSDLPESVLRAIPLTFSPTRGGARQAELRIVLRRTDGTLKEQRIVLGGFAVGADPLRLAIPANQNLQALAGGEATLEVVAENGAPIPVRTLRLTFAMNTDLLTPSTFDVAGGIMDGATVSGPALFADSAQFTITLPTARTFNAGTVGRLKANAFVTDTFQTDIAISSSSIEGAMGPSTCLSTLSDGGGRVGSFTLIPECADITISGKLKGNSSDILVRRVYPNPASSVVMLDVLVSGAYANDGVIEIFDARGHTQQMLPLQIAEPGLHTISIALDGTPGARYIRITTPRGTVTERVVLER